VIAEVDGKAAGFALCFYNYSTFQGKAGIYLEDLYVRDEYRGQGIGKGFFRFLAQKAIDEDCGRIQWWVLNWNEPSIEFYKSLGAVAMDEWTVMRLEGTAINNVLDKTKQQAA
jgi:GNAT superfamily N-acetyltransferase